MQPKIKFFAGEIPGRSLFRELARDEEYRARMRSKSWWSRAAILFAAWFVASASGQTLNLACSPASIAAGVTTICSVNFADSAPASSTAALQFTIVPPAGFTAGAAVAAAGSTSLQKQITCSPSGLLCLIYGLNTTSLASGILATFPLTAAAGQIAGPNTVALTGALGASGTGSAVALGVTGATVTVLSTYDLNGDGKIDGADVQIAIMAFQGGASACVGRISTIGDGKCDVLSVFFIVLAALGLIH